MTNWLRVANGIKRTVGSKMTALGLAYVAELVELAPHRGWLVDLGTWKGASAAMMAKAAPGRDILTVDIFLEPEDAQTGEGEAPDPLEVQEMLERRFPSVVLLLQDTVVPARRLKRAGAAFVLVDADHTGWGVRRDIEAWKPLVVPGGIMAFDDYGSARWPEVKPTVDELMGDWERLGVRGGVAAYRRIV